MCQTDILIESKFTKDYGEFHKEWKEKIIPIEKIINNNKIVIGHDISWINEITNKTVNISPIFILLGLIDSNIDANLIPQKWKECKINDEYVKIKFKNKKILYLNKTNKKIVDKIHRKPGSNIIRQNIPVLINENDKNQNNKNILSLDDDTEKVSFLTELENVDKIMEEAKILKKKEKEEEIKKYKEQKLLSKLLGNKHILNKNKIQRKKNASDSESEENLLNEYEDVNNLDHNLTTAELKIKYTEEIKNYKELLKENLISIQNNYENELPKLIYDPRYLKIPKKLRQRIFDEYVREKDDEKVLINIDAKQELKNPEKILKDEQENFENKINNLQNIEENNKNNNDLKKIFEDVKNCNENKNIKKLIDHNEKNKRKISQDKLKSLIKSQIEKGEIHSNTPYLEFEMKNIENDDFNNALQIDREFLFNEAKLKVKKILEESKNFLFIN